MSGLPEAGLGEELEASWFGRVRGFVGARMSYALGDQVVFSLGNLAVAALVARHSVAREFGVYILTQRAMDVLVQMSNVFVWAPYTYNLPQTAVEARRSYLGSIVAHQVISCVLAAVVMLACGVGANFAGSALYAAVFWPLVLTSSGIMFREFTRRMYFAELRLKEAFWTDVVTNGLQAAGAWWLVMRGQMSVGNVLWVLSGAAWLVSVWWMVRERRTVRVEAGRIVADLKRNLTLGRWFLGSNMVYTVSSQCNPWVISWLDGGALVGAYSVCESVVNIPRVALNSLQNVMAPMMARAMAEGGRPKLGRLVAKMDRLLTAGSAGFAVLIVVAGPWVAKTIYKTAPADVHWILGILALNFVAFAMTMAQSYAMSAMERPQRTLAANAIGLAVQLAAAAVLIRAYQLPGAAAALLAGSVVVAAVRWVYYQQEMRRGADTGREAAQ